LLRQVSYCRTPLTSYQEIRHLPRRACIEPRCRRISVLLLLSPVLPV
jgi:hypothetical protein